MSDPRIENARQLMAAGKLDEAMGVLKAALKDDPANADVKALLVEIQERLMLQLQIDEKMKRVHLLLKEGFKENAQTLLEEILKIDGQNREASELLQQLKTGGEAPAKPPEAPAPPAESPPAAGVDSEELPFGPPQPFDDSQAFPEGGPKLDESEPSPPSQRRLRWRSPLSR
ncbi:MAG: tetratricopeptide repeat protein [Acidobacteriota bacterium]